MAKALEHTHKAPLSGPPVEGESKKGKKGKAAATDGEHKAPKSDKPSRGRESALSGKFLYPAEKLEGKNPRREGVPGWHSMTIVLKRPGITTAKYLESGGRLEDLRWDVKHGNIEAADDKRD